MWKRLDRRILNAFVGCTIAATSVSMTTRTLPCRADDAEVAVTAADSAAAKKAAAAQKALAQQKISAILRARRAQALRTTIAYDDVFGQGAASLASVTSANFNSGTSSGSGSSAGSSYGYSAGAGYSSLLGGTTGTSTTGNGTGSTTSGTNSTGTGVSTSQTGSSTVGSRIVEFAMNQLGQKVGNGSSRALIDAALSYAGAKSASQLQTQNQAQHQTQSQTQSQSQNQNPSHNQGRGHCRSAGQMSYGDVIDLSSAQPGDILQFEDAVFLGMNYWMIMGTPEQLAIVYLVKGNEVILLDQDVNGVKLVQFTTINLADLNSGTITAYHPVSNDSSSDSSQTDGSTGTTASQTGTSSASTATQSGTTSTGSTSKTVGTSNATTTQTQSSSGS